MDGIQLYFTPKPSNSLFLVAETCDVPMSLKENNHLNLECHQTLDDLDPTVSSSRFEMAVCLSVLQSQKGPKTPPIKRKLMSAVSTQGQKPFQPQKTNPDF